MEDISISVMEIMVVPGEILLCLLDTGHADFRAGRWVSFERWSVPKGS